MQETKKKGAQTDKARTKAESRARHSCWERAVNLKLLPQTCCLYAFLYLFYLYNYADREKENKTEPGSTTQTVHELTLLRSPFYKRSGGVRVF